MRAALIACLLAWSPVMGAAAQSSDATMAADDAEARSLFEAGVRAYESGRFDRALEHFRRAYELSSRPALLYNVGQAADRLRHDAEALEAFERYLASDAVDPARRGELEARVVALREAVARAPATGPVGAPGPSSGDGSASAGGPDDDAPAAAGSGDPTAGIAILVASGAVAAGGSVMLGIAASENAAVQGAPERSSWADYQGRLDTANALLVVGGIALGVGIAGVAIGGIVIGSSGSSTARVSLGPGSIELRGSF